VKHSHKWSFAKFVQNPHPTLPTKKQLRKLFSNTQYVPARIYVPPVFDVGTDFALFICECGQTKVVKMKESKIIFK
jgi:hypothetical protein